MSLVSSSVNYHPLAPPLPRIPVAVQIQDGADSSDPNPGRGVGGGDTSDIC